MHLKSLEVVGRQAEVLSADSTFLPIAMSSQTGGAADAV
jgi:hypothetical protein